MPSSFLTPLELEYIDGRWWSITREFQYLIDFDNLHSAIRVPAGFHTDFASIPRILWNVYPPVGKYGKAAVIHDWLYRNGGVVDCHQCVVENAGIELGDIHEEYTKQECDRIFYDAMGVLGVGGFTRWIMWKMVGMFGGSSFKVGERVHVKGEE